VARKTNLILQVKEYIRIIDYAEQLGFEIKKIGNDTYTIVDHDSIRITESKNLYSRHSNQGKGGSIIDFVMEFDERYPDLRSATSHLIRQLRHIDTEEKPLFKALKRERGEGNNKTFKLNKRIEGMYTRAWAYLVSKRKIDPEIVSQAIERKEIYQDEKGNVCFCGKDYDGKIKYAHARTTLTNADYRGDMPNSDKKVSFSINLSCPIGDPPTKLFVSEGAIDCLSLMTLTKIHHLNENEYGYLSLSGVSTKALEYHITKNPQIETIYLCQDNDEAGNSSRKKCREKLEELGFNGKVIDKPPKNKDYNDDLVRLSEENKITN